MRSLQGREVDRLQSKVDPYPDELTSVYSSLFLQFDHDSNGSVDLEEFKAEMKEMMLAMAWDACLFKWHLKRTAFSSSLLSWNLLS
ncbi:hypothetical protein RJ641_035202 [Dillenia turbinata]|uniref:EF-hand domain-containing protein n=1 Tax=Dillenia turbinata TaxID=194707 RepID=A0AAN8VSR0_9MAGN